MPRSTTLIVYYSRTGTTRIVADAIADRTGADVAALVDAVDRNGPRGFLRSMRDAARKRGTVLKPLPVDPAAYELVIIGTPDWGRSVSAPVRTFLEENRGRLRRVAFFLTDGTQEHAAVFRDMAALVGREPVATLGIPSAEVTQRRYTERVASFVRALPSLAPTIEAHP